MSNPKDKAPVAVGSNVPFIKWQEINAGNIKDQYEPKQVALVKESREDKKTKTVRFVHYVVLIVDPKWLTIKEVINEDLYNKILLKKAKKNKDWEKFDDQGREILEHGGPVWVRFIKGKYKDGNEYRQVEIAFGEGISVRYFFKNDRLDILLDREADKNDPLVINWRIREDAIDNVEDETPDF